MLPSCEEMIAAERAALLLGHSAESLMDEAGIGIARAVQRWFPEPGILVLALGKGHNAGDALVAARHLFQVGWEIELWSAFPAEQWRELTQKKGGELGQTQEAASTAPRWKPGDAIVILDALLGIGARGPLREPIAGMTHRIAEARFQEGAHVVALDIPTGLDPDSGTPGQGAVVADLTFAIAAPKRGILADEAAEWTGRIEVIPLTSIPVDQHASDQAALAGPSMITPWLPKRTPGWYKGRAGRVGIVAGSKGLLGAALLCSTAALRGGAGLVTLFVKSDVWPVAAAAAPPEIMVQMVDDFREVERRRLDVLVVGPGIGTAVDDEIEPLLRHFPGPVVVDADALPIWGRLRHAQIEHPRLLTPHPGEMDSALLPRSAASGTRRSIAEKYVTGAGSLEVLHFKGTRSLTLQKGHPAVFNPTGHAGMATGGVGDTLAGLCGALLGQEVGVREAAILGAWLNGRAAELATGIGDQTEESLTASDLPRFYGRAFRDLRDRHL